MISGKILNIGRLHCPIEYLKGGLFFSLVDYRNNYFTSDDPNKIIEFYNGFENRDQLIQWMRERPKGVVTIHEVEGDKEIIVVIPTADFNGKYAKECRENIFKGLHMVFVESGGRGDFYFNIAHNVNVGIKKAMEYNPKWIVISADDMYKIDDISVLKNELTRLDPDRFSMVFTQESAYHSIPARFSKLRRTRFFILLYYTKLKLKQRIKIASDQKNIERKFECKYFVIPKRGLTKLAYKRGFNFISFTDFSIYSSSFVRYFSGNIYDEVFVNSQEDHDIAIEFFLENRAYNFIDFKIGDYVGSTLGTGVVRNLRELTGIVYLNYKYMGKVTI